MALRVSLVAAPGLGHPRLEIPSNPEAMYPHAERLNSVAVDSADGIRHVFDFGPTRVTASIAWKCVDCETAKKYENFLLRVAIPGHSFFIACPEYIDFGMGMGNNIEKAYYAGPATTKDLIVPAGGAGLYYDIELPYMFVRDNA